MASPYSNNPGQGLASLQYNSFGVEGPNNNKTFSYKCLTCTQSHGQAEPDDSKLNDVKFKVNELGCAVHIE